MTIEQKIDNYALGLSVIYHFDLAMNPTYVVNRYFRP